MSRPHRGSTYGWLRVTALGVVFSAAYAGCGGDDGGSVLAPTSAPPPAETRTATPTATIGIDCDSGLNGPSRGPTPGPQVLFRFLDPSSVVLPDGSTEPLHGDLLASYCFSPNTFFAARVEKLRLSSQTLLVESGCAAVGHLIVSTLYGGDMPAEFFSTVRIGSEVLVLSGQGPYASPPPPLILNLSAGGYELRLVEATRVVLNPEADYPSCSDWGFQ